MENAICPKMFISVQDDLFLKLYFKALFYYLNLFSLESLLGHLFMLVSLAVGFPQMAGDPCLFSETA